MANEIFIEAESFDEHGGWVVDSGSMETIHSSYLMAHGMGVPVCDAVTEFTVEYEAEYNIWALTRDWTAVWNANARAGKFRIAADGKELPETLGTNGTEWAWQRAGAVMLKKGVHKLALHDLTGFNGRCDAIYLTDSAEVPESSVKSIDAMRKRLNWKEIEDSGREYDLIVAGGGIAGICTALAAIRSGAEVLLVNDRAVLGGCNSSEIRVCMGGMINLKPYVNIGNVVREIAPVMGDPAIFKEQYYEDFRKLAAFEASDARESVLLNRCVTDAITEDGKISAIICTDTLTGKKYRYKAKLFSDCTGDAVLSRLAGAQTMYGRESESEFGETLAPKAHENLVMGHSIRWYSEENREEKEFPDIDWGLKFNDENCLDVYSGDWEQETGFARNMVHEAEYIRDFGLRAIYSNWAYQKNHFADKEKFKNYELKWVSPFGGKRESYRVKGEHILTQQDIEEHKVYEDATACMTWSIDLHFPEPDNKEEFGEPFRSFAYHRGIVQPYPVPYRCLYSRNIKNLFIGGRAVSASHVAFSAIRVMRTLGSLGEAAGIAAAICARKNCIPSDIYGKYLTEFEEKLNSGVEIPSAFACSVGDEEAYHFKDIGWLYLNEKYVGTEKEIQKFKRGIKALGIKHKYPLQKEFKD